MERLQRIATFVRKYSVRLLLLIVFASVVFSQHAYYLSAQAGQTARVDAYIAQHRHDSEKRDKALQKSNEQFLKLIAELQRQKKAFEISNLGDTGFFVSVKENGVVTLYSFSEYNGMEVSYSH